MTSIQRSKAAKFMHCVILYTEKKNTEVAWSAQTNFQRLFGVLCSFVKSRQDVFGTDLHHGTPFSTLPYSLPASSIWFDITTPTTLSSIRLILHLWVQIKPDGVQRSLVGEIIKRFEQKGYYLRGLKYKNVEKELAEEHYVDLASKPFYGSLVEYIGRYTIFSPPLMQYKFADRQEPVPVSLPT